MSGTYIVYPTASQLRQPSTDNTQKAIDLVINPDRWQNMTAYNNFMQYKQRNKITKEYLEDLLNESLAGSHKLTIIGERLLASLLWNTRIQQIKGGLNKGKKRTKKISKNKTNKRTKRNKRNKRNKTNKKK